MDAIGLMLAAVASVALVIYLIHFLARGISRRVGERAAQQGLLGDRPPWVRPGFAFSLLLILIGAYVFWNLLRYGPPEWVRQRALRRAVLQRVEDSGGWACLSADARLLAATNNSGLPVRFSPGQTNVVLPESIKQLRPITIEVNPNLITNTVLLQFFQFGRFRKRASYSLWVAPELTREEAQVAYRTKSRQQGRIRQLAPGVFEFN